jgi:dTMP kinase
MGSIQRGLFITFEGGEGAGKTTLIRKVREALEGEGFSCLVTREPGGTALGEQIRNLLLHQSEMSPWTELLLFLAARTQHLHEVILPAIQEGKIVLCDRFNDSSIAYQGVGRALGREKVAALCSVVTEEIQPDLTFYLDLTPQEGFARAHKDQRTLDRLESLKMDFHEKVRQGFLDIAKDDPARVVVVSAAKSEDQVFQSTLEALRAKLGKHV